MARLIDNLENRRDRIPLAPHLQAVVRTRQWPALTLHWPMKQRSLGPVERPFVEATSERPNDGDSEWRLLAARCLMHRAYAM